MSDCMNCLCILPLPLLHSSPSSPLSLRQRLMRQGISGPLLPCVSGSIEGKPDCQWTQTASELLAQPQWSLRTPTTSHLQQWLSVFLQNKFQSNSQTEISCSERVCMDVCARECVCGFFIWLSSFSAFISDPIDLPSDPSLAAQLHRTIRTTLAWPPTLYVLVRVVECRRLWTP